MRTFNLTLIFVLTALTGYRLSAGFIPKPQPSIEAENSTKARLSCKTRLVNLAAKLVPEYKEQDVAKIIMACNIKLMEGFRLYLGSSKAQDEAIRRLYPSKELPNEFEKADRIIMYQECEHITQALQDYLKGCEE